MSSDSGGEYKVKLDVKPGRVVSDGQHEVTLKCSFSNKGKKPHREEIPVKFKIKKQRIEEERRAKKGSAIFRFRPERPTGKTKVVCETPYGNQTGWLLVQPTPAQYIREMVMSILVAFIVAFGIIRPFILQTYYIPSGSMEPTLYEGDRLVAFMFTYRFRDPRPGEIVIFEKEDDFEEYRIPLGFTTIKWRSYTKFIKRIIAVGGDVIEVRDLTVYVNGKPLDEPYIKAPPVSNTPPYKVPEGHVFVMGDNRNNSNDARFWGPHRTPKALPKDKIVSKAIFRFWPPSRIGIFHQEPIKNK